MKDARSSSQGDAGLKRDTGLAAKEPLHKLLLESLPFDEARPRLSSEILEVIDPRLRTEDKSLANLAGIEFYPSFIPVPRCCHWTSATLCLLIASEFVASPIRTTIRGDELSAPHIVLFVVFALVAFGFGVYFIIRGQRNYKIRRPLFDGSACLGSGRQDTTQFAKNVSLNMMESWYRSSQRGAFCKSTQSPVDREAEGLLRISSIIQLGADILINCKREKATGCMLTNWSEVIYLIHWFKRAKSGEKMVARDEG